MATNTTALHGRWACRFCGHDQYAAHNLAQGCVSCSCLATPREAAPRTDAESDAAILPDGRFRSGYESTGLAAQLLAAVETFGVDDTRAALREIRDRDTKKEG